MRFNWLGLVAIAALLQGDARARESDWIPSPRQSRERIALDADWRFRRGDPDDLGISLDYDARPAIDPDAAARDADARPEAAETLDAARDVLKPWILPTANTLISDASRRHVRPDGNPGGDLDLVAPGFDDATWERVVLPHDWAIAGPFIAEGAHGGMGRLPSWGVGWYRRKLDIAATDRGRSIFLDVDGAMSYATVWLNGKLVGGWPYGYNGWRVDLTPHVRPGGVNQLAIRLDNPPQSARWYPGGGLYRRVWLVKADPVHVAQWGVHVTTPEVSSTSATVRMQIAVRNDSPHAVGLVAATAIFALDEDGEHRGEPLAIVASSRRRIAARATATFDDSTRLLHPRLWGPPPSQHPHRHLAVTRLLDGDRELDRIETVFGIRTVRFDPEAGLRVNGERIVLQGVNNHHDLGALGAAFNRRAAERQLEILRDMGTNAIRMAHNPPASELLELTDRMGMLVIDEIFDSWELKKTALDFHRIFPDWHEPDLRAMLRRDRNHPSVILWSIGNEVGEQYTGDAGAAIARRLASIVREEDPGRPTITAMNWAKPDMPLPATVDVIGLNYQGEGIRQEPEFEGTDRIRTPPQYLPYRIAHPGKAIVSTETASTLSTRGTYLFPVSSLLSAPVREGRGGDAARRFVSAYEVHAVDFGSTPDKVFASLDRHPFVAGEFVWTGFDYLGEPTPYYDSRSSYSGIVDLAGFPKDRYYLYQSRWRPDLPMAHLLPHWNWPERIGQVTPVHVFTSGDEAELFVNDVSQGRRRKSAFEYRLRWDDVVYAPGELRVQTWRDGEPWAEARTRTSGPPARIELASDRDALGASRDELAFVTARLVDADGNPVPDADTRLRFRIEGSGDLVATDNGDPTDMNPFVSHERNLFGGLALAIVRARDGEPGTITLHAEAEGLPAARVAILTRAPDQDRYVKRAPHWPIPRMDTAPPTPPRIEREGAMLIFSKTNGYRDDAQIRTPNAALTRLASDAGREAYLSENAAVFSPDALSRFDVVILNNTSGNVFLPAQRAALRHWLERGGGLVALHGAGGDHHYDWDWYVDVVLGARFIGHTSHPNQFQHAVIDVADPAHPAMTGLPARWEREDEWYAFDREPSGYGTRILARLDESTYTPDPAQRMGNHPVVWTRRIGLGRVFYSALGHRPDAYAEPWHLAMIKGAIAWASGAEPDPGGVDAIEHRVR